ncbi:hypothetical protein BDK51DRAFT_30873 [Blyttiomyces helicus]|uniref:Uncharacterized protein n=1 Tax=Blyttiomyces helicus TaxID=388810 RepID=A0A4P9WKM8_9FUNG|nr:hypothetical protein BDK51DRAFT_30873 [Blyttiomyces helicus]|eukprot:RKO91166.1 hypothetical protein BDK51DRAFT_30873 [Blyttiomyces helicus]
MNTRGHHLQREAVRGSRLGVVILSDVDLMAGIEGSGGMWGCAGEMRRSFRNSGDSSQRYPNIGEVSGRKLWTIIFQSTVRRRQSTGVLMSWRASHEYSGASPSAGGCQNVLALRRSFCRASSWGSEEDIGVGGGSCQMNQVIRTMPNVFKLLAVRIALQNGE